VLAETLAEGVDDAAQRLQFQRQLAEQIERLSGMVERMVHLSRLESATDGLQLEELHPAELLETAADHVAPVAAAGDVRVSVGESDAPAVTGDRGRTLEVLENLLSNAIQFSPPGGTVRLTASAAGDEVRFTVRDEGPGILPAERGRVFERFFTGDHSRAREGEGGSGLGLAIARHIVSRHGGRIWVAESDAGERGATLCFTLPVA
jgi:two-component system phosphate regulon sensor histidine kinase PhoR